MFDLDTLRDYESRKLIKSSERDGFTVWCYTQQCVVERAWDDVTRACRGLVLSPVGALVSRPFPKFHNYGEPEAKLEDGPFLAFDKMDGTLIIVGTHEGQPVVSTKGSFDTWHSEAARELLMGWQPPEGVTALFELIHPENRIVVDYGDYTGLVFLGAIDNATGADVDHPERAAIDMGWHGDIVVARNFNLKSMLKTIENPEAGAGREGFVVAWVKDGEPWNRVKLKFDLYVKLHGIYTGLTNRRVWECMVDGTMAELMDLAPDELHADIKEVRDEIAAVAGGMYNDAASVAERVRKLDRREAAEEILENLDRPVAGIAFKILDSKASEAASIALKLARPEVSRFVGSAGLS